MHSVHCGVMNIEFLEVWIANEGGALLLQVAIERCPGCQATLSSSCKDHEATLLLQTLCTLYRLGLELRLGNI